MTEGGATLGFIGLGEQGLALARNLLGAGHRLYVHDIRPSRIALAVASGAMAAGPTDKVADITFVCVKDGKQLDEAMTGPDGLIARASPGSLICIHSTVAPELVATIFLRAAEREIAIVDAPLAGGVSAAQAGNLLFMLGGTAEAVARCAPLLAASGRHVAHVGPVGAGMKAKLVHQAILCGNLIAAREGFDLAHRLNLDSQAIRDIILQSSAQSRLVERIGEISLSNHDLRLLVKDLEICVAHAGGRRGDLPGISATKAIIEDWGREAGAVR